MVRLRPQWHGVVMVRVYCMVRLHPQCHAQCHAQCHDPHLWCHDPHLWCHAVLSVLQCPLLSIASLPLISTFPSRCSLPCQQCPLCQTCGPTPRAPLTLPQTLLGPTPSWGASGPPCLQGPCPVALSPGPPRPPQGSWAPLGQGTGHPPCLRWTCGGSTALGLGFRVQGDCCPSMQPWQCLMQRRRCLMQRQQCLRQPQWCSS